MHSVTTTTTSNWVLDLTELHLTPPHLPLEWLYKPYILSDALEQIYPDLELILFRQSLEGIGSIHRCELEKFKEFACTGYDKPNPQWLIREIALDSAQSGRCTLGRVVIPEQTYFAHQRIFDALKTAPMGKTMLYHNPKVRRSGFEFTQIQTHSCYHPFVSSHQMTAPQSVLARRSTFWIESHPLLVIEFFVSTFHQNEQNPQC